MIKNLKGLGGDYEVKMLNRLHILCEVEWPPEDAVNLKTVEAVFQ